MPEHQQTQQSKNPESSPQRRIHPASQIPVSHPASIIQRARINPKSLTPADVLQLQRTIGNRAVGRLLSEIRNPSKVQQAPIQRQEIPEEEEPLQGKLENKPEEETCPSCMQRQEIPEEEEKLQMKSVVQRQEIPEEEEPLQGKMADPVQRQEIPEEEEPLQGKMLGTVQRQEIPEEEEPLQTKKENNTGMPNNLKAGVESLSRIDMSDVRVHYNSSKPAEVGALAYTQGTNIHVAPGQERYLPHEAWHVVQQAQGRVRPTMQLNRIAVNDDLGLEKEADRMGESALQLRLNMKKSQNTDESLQRVVSSKLFNIPSMANLHLKPDIDSRKSQHVMQFGRGKESKHDRKARRLKKIQGEEISLPIEEEKGFSIAFHSKAKNPYSAEEVQKILDMYQDGMVFDINPQRILTMHAGISGKFSDDREITELAEMLVSDPSYIRKFPTINVCAIELPRRAWERTDMLEPRYSRELALFSEDHRRVVAARIAGITQMPALMRANPDTVTGKFTTKNRGMSVEVRRYLETEAGRHQRGNKTTLPSSSRIFRSEPEEQK